MPAPPKITLPPETCTVLDHFLKTAKPPSHVVRRVLAIRAVAARSRRKEVIAAQGVAPGSLYRWINQFAQHGVASLLDRSRSGRPPALTPEQDALLLRLVATDPRRSGLNRRRWTHAALAAQCSRLTSLPCNRETVRRRLARHPVTPYSPTRLGHR